MPEDALRINMGSHDTRDRHRTRSTGWGFHYNVERHEAMVKAFKRPAFKTGDTMGLGVDGNHIPAICRL